MHIHGLAHLHGPQQINGPHHTRAAQPDRPPTETTGGDRLEISDAARVAARLNEVPDIRQDRVAEVRAAIADGTYETDEKLDLAIDRLLDEIG